MHSLVVIECNGEEELRFGLKGGKQDCSERNDIDKGDTVPRKSTKEKSQELEESDNEGWLSVIVTQDLNYFVIKTKGFFGSWFWKV